MSKLTDLRVLHDRFDVEAVNQNTRSATMFDLVEVLRVEGAFVWYCEAWEQRRGVSEPCESGSAHDAPDFNCHWRFAP